jgi:hypothetical protein
MGRVAAGFALLRSGAGCHDEGALDEKEYTRVGRELPLRTAATSDPDGIRRAPEYDRARGSRAAAF